MSDALNQSPTSAEFVAVPEDPVGPPETMTIAERASDVADRAGHIRNRSTLVSRDAAEVQHDALRLQLDARTARSARQDPAALLNQLSQMGFAWRDIARMVGVSVPALRRWRNGELPGGENRRRIAQLVAFAEIICDDHLVFEPASWMEVPIVSDAPTTPIDLYATGHLDVVFDLAADHCSPEAALDAAIPDWRERFRSNWEVGTAEDGQPYIRSKPGR